MNGEQNPEMVPVGIGDEPAQQRFLRRHRPYLVEAPKLIELCNKVFNRPLQPPDESERQLLLDANLRDDDPTVVAWEDRVTAGNLIFHFGLMACDDFSAITLLSGNGAGFSAFILLRSMYERLVTALYIAKNPAEARTFAESSPIYKLNFLTRLRELVPEIKARYDDAFMDEIRQNAAASKAKRKQSVCNKCGQPITNDAWTRVSLDVMAREVDADLEKLYGAIYIEGTCQGHANSLGMERRLEETENGYRYKSNSEAEASLAVQFAHRLMLRLVDFQNAYFKLGHDQEVKQRFEAYNAIWDQLQTRVGNAPSAA